eukprot:scaffold135508_cov33-Tisochrysis_lutea.AAC.2
MLADAEALRLSSRIEHSLRGPKPNVPLALAGHCCDEGAGARAARQWRWRDRDKAATTAGSHDAWQSVQPHGTAVSGARAWLGEDGKTRAVPRRGRGESAATA